jgi:hypothetical protein
LGTFVFYPFIFVNPAINQWGLPDLLPIYLLFGLIIIFNRRLGRKMEIRADSFASEKQVDEGEYARMNAAGIKADYQRLMSQIASWVSLLEQTPAFGTLCTDESNRGTI